MEAAFNVMKKLMESGDDELVRGAIEELEVASKVRIVILRPSFFTCLSVTPLHYGNM
jgi:non-homologous end joining protein Ku